VDNLQMYRLPVLSEPWHYVNHYSISHQPCSVFTLWKYCIDRRSVLFFKKCGKIHITRVCKRIIQLMKIGCFLLHSIFGYPVFKNRVSLKMVVKSTSHKSYRLGHFKVDGSAASGILTVVNRPPSPNRIHFILQN